MKLKWWISMAVILFLTGCMNIQENLTHEEILERTMEKMLEVESYSFEINSEQIDGFENEAVLDIQGETIVTPFRASIDQHLDFLGGSRESNTYYIEDMIYYEDFTAPDFLFKTDHFFTVGC